MALTVFTLFATVAFLSFPVVMTWGWMRWKRRKRPMTLISALSLIGFVLATTSELIAIAMVIYARITGGFGFYDPTLMRIYVTGMLLSGFGLILAIAGAWKPSSLRWHALVCTLGTLVYWLVQAAGE